MIGLRLSLPLVYDLLQLGVGDAGVLEGVGGVLVAELPLHGGDVAGLTHDVPPHRVAGGVGGLPLHLRPAAGLVPDGVDDLGRQAAGAFDLAAGRSRRSRDGQKVLLAVMNMGGESEAAWRACSMTWLRAG